MGLEDHSKSRAVDEAKATEVEDDTRPRVRREKCLSDFVDGRNVERPAERDDCRRTTVLDITTKRFRLNQVPSSSRSNWINHPVEQ